MQIRYGLKKYRKATKQAIMNGEKAFKKFFDGKESFPKFKKKKNQDVKAYFPKNNKTDWTIERHRIKVPTNSALVANDILKEDSPNSIVHVFDSKSAAAGETLVVLKIKQLLEEKTPALQIFEKINEYISNMKTFFILKSYTNLVKNGRISSVKAFIGSLINIVPIMGDNGDGEIDLKDKVRGHQKP